MTQTSQKSRQHKRRPETVRVGIRPVTTPDGFSMNVQEILQTVDVSEGGLFVQTSLSCPVNTLVEITLGDSAEKTHFGRVAHQMDLNGNRGLGIEFLNN